MSVELKKEQEKKSGSQRLYEEIVEALRSKKININTVKISELTERFEKEIHDDGTYEEEKVFVGLKNGCGQLGTIIAGCLGELRINVWGIPDTEIKDKMANEKNCLNESHYFSEELDEALDMLYPEIKGSTSALEHIGNIIYMNGRYKTLSEETTKLFGDELSKKVLGLSYVAANLEAAKALREDIREQEVSANAYVFEDGKLHERDEHLIDFYGESSLYLICASAIAYTGASFISKPKSKEPVYDVALRTYSNIICRNGLATYNGSLIDFWERHSNDIIKAFPIIYSRFFKTDTIRSVIDYAKEEQKYLEKERRDQAINMFKSINWTMFRRTEEYMDAFNKLKEIITKKTVSFEDAQKTIRGCMPNYDEESTVQNIAMSMFENLNIGYWYFRGMTRQKDDVYSSNYCDIQTVRDRLIQASNNQSTLIGGLGSNFLKDIRTPRQTIRFSEDVTKTKAVAIVVGKCLTGETGTVGMFRVSDGVFEEIDPYNYLGNINNMDDALAINARTIRVIVGLKKGKEEKEKPKGLRRFFKGSRDKQEG